jgi:hypothetical protein
MGSRLWQRHEFDLRGCTRSRSRWCGDRDFFIVVLDSAGNFYWGAGIGGIGDDFALHVAFGPEGNVFASGTFEDLVDFDPGPGTAPIEGSFDPFIVKLNNSGVFQWAHKTGGEGGGTIGPVLHRGHGSISIRFVLTGPDCS